MEMPRDGTKKKIGIKQKPTEDNLKHGLYTNFFESLIAGIPACLFWMDKNGVYQGCNQAYATLVGLDLPNEIYNKRNHDLPYYHNKPEQAVGQDKVNLEVITAIGKAKTLEERFELPDKTHITFLSYKIPIRNDQRKNIGLISLAVNISNQKNNEALLLIQKEQAELTLDHIMAHMPGHVYWKNLQGIYLGCNDRQARSLGFNHGHEIIGKTDFELPWSSESAHIFQKNDREVIRTEEAVTTEEKVEIADTKTIMLSQKVPLKNKQDKIIGVLGISTDITYLKQVELELKVIKEKANQLKLDFIRNMQHDIRTPFIGVWGMSNQLYQQETDPLKKELLRDITECAKELLDYCNDIIDFSKIDLAILPITEKKFELRKLIDSTLRIELPAAKMKQLTLILEYPDNIPPILVGDDYRLQKILLNLLSNAIKFTQEGEVKLQVQLAKQTDDRHLILRFFIHDTGIGIAPEKQDFIYEKFVRIEPSNKGLYKGMGLGLRIVKQFITELEGEINLTSQLGKGSTFVCTLPFKLPLVNDML